MENENLNFYEFLEKHQVKDKKMSSHIRIFKK